MQLARGARAGVVAARPRSAARNLCMHGVRVAELSCRRRRSVLTAVLIPLSLAKVFIDQLLPSGGLSGA